MLLIGLSYIIIPLLLIGIIAFVRQASILNWALSIFAFGLVIAFLWAASRWDIIGIYFRTLIPILFIIACLAGFKRIRKPEKPPKKIVTIIGIVINAAVIIFFSGLNWFTFQGYAAPQDGIDLSSPFRNGRYVVLHGGASPFINGHFHVKPQTYAQDIVALNKLGMRASSIAGGPDLEKYAIYGNDLYCPCNGTVLLAVDKFDDLIPPKRDPENPAGNHVLVECQGAEVLLAHLKKGSVRVKAGDSITTNTLLGQVGNSGNTSEPHLHLHVERGGAPNTILNGEAVPFTSIFLER